MKDDPTVADGVDDEVGCSACVTGVNDGTGAAGNMTPVVANNA